MSYINIRFLFSLIISVSLMSFIVFPTTAIYATTKSTIKEFITNYYVDEVDPTIFDNTIDDIFKELDPYSTYYTEEQLNEFLNAIDQSFVGIGISIEKVEQGILVQTVFPNSPAELAELEAGDIITHVDELSLIGKSTDQAASLIKGEAKTTVNLRIIREEDVLWIETIRDNIQLPTVSNDSLAGDVGYIKVHSFNNQTTVELKEAIIELKDSKHWIIDLRNNPGGYLHAAREMLGFFNGVDLAIMSEAKSEATPYAVLDQNVKFQQPVDLLVNQYSASASEIVAGALKDYGAAKIYGLTTFGKGLMQRIFPLVEGGAVKLSTARFFTPNYNSIQDVGIKPTIETETPLMDAHYQALSELNDYAVLPPMTSASIDKTFFITLNTNANVTSLKEHIELIELGGKTVAFTISHEKDSLYSLSPISNLIKNQDYAIMIHPGWESEKNTASVKGVIQHINVK